MATHHARATMPRANTTSEQPHRRDGDRAGPPAKIKRDVDGRLAAMAAKPPRWVEFIDHEAVLGARYRCGYPVLLPLQTEEPGVTPRPLLPNGSNDASTGCKTRRRSARAGQKAFKISAAGPAPAHPGTGGRRPHRAGAGTGTRRPGSGRRRCGRYSGQMGDRVMDPHTDERFARAMLGWLCEPGDAQLAQLLAEHSPTETLDMMARHGVRLGLRSQREGGDSGDGDA